MILVKANDNNNNGITIELLEHHQFNIINGVVWLKLPVPIIFPVFFFFFSSTVFARFLSAKYHIARFDNDSESEPNSENFTLGILFIVNKCHVRSRSSAETRVCSCDIQNVPRVSLENMISFVGPQFYVHIIVYNIWRTMCWALFRTLCIQHTQHLAFVHCSFKCRMPQSIHMKRNLNAQLSGMCRCTKYLVRSVHFHLSKSIIIHLLVLNMRKMKRIEHPPELPIGCYVYYCTQSFMKYWNWLPFDRFKRFN